MVSRLSSVQHFDIVKSDQRPLKEEHRSGPSDEENVRVTGPAPNASTSKFGARHLKQISHRGINTLQNAVAKPNTEAEEMREEVWKKQECSDADLIGRGPGGTTARREENALGFIMLPGTGFSPVFSNSVGERSPKETED